jgi:hypothetical protein
MELLMTNQPWNLILFMVIPVVLAETLAISEFFILLRKSTEGSLVQLNRIAGILAGPYFAIVFVYLLVTAVIPLSTDAQWRGAFDIIAVGFYLLGVVPYVAITLIELRLIGKDYPVEKRLKAHAIFVALFLVVAHVAMIFGMLDPSLLDASSISAGADVMNVGGSDAGNASGGSMGMNMNM